MEPITTTAIATLVSYLGGKAFDKAFDTAAGEFTKDSIGWLKTIFFQDDDQPKEALKDLKENPENELNQEAAILAVKKGIQKDPAAEKWLQEIVRVIKSKEAKGEPMTKIVNSKNIITGNVRVGGNFTQGDNNN